MMGLGKIFLVSGLAGAFALGACGSDSETSQGQQPADCPVGSKGCDCTGGDGCDKDLSCVMGKCVVLPGGGNGGASNGKGGSTTGGGANPTGGATTGV